MARLEFTQDVVYTLAKIFSGGPEIEGYYKYKDDEELREFFYVYFDFEDMYNKDKGFDLARFDYLVDKLNILIAQDRFDDFINVILSPRYIAKEYLTSEKGPITKEEAEKKMITNFKMISDVLYPEGYTISANNGKYIIKKEEESFIEEEYKPFADGSQALIYKHKAEPIILKQLFPTLRDDGDFKHRFKREYEITASLSEIEGVIKVFDYNDNNYTYKMEALDCTLYDRFKRGDNIEKSQRIRYIEEILQIMAEVHEKDVIHRDLHPSNVFLKNDKIIIADFGLGKDLNRIYSYQIKQRKNWGHETYSPTEQQYATGADSKACDVYAIGKIINSILTEDPENYNHIFKEITQKATSFNPDKRYKDAGELKMDFEKRVNYLKSLRNQEENTTESILWKYFPN